MPTATMTKYTGHVDRATSRLIMQFRDKPRIVAFVAAIANEVQQLENAAWDVLLLRALDNPLTSGAQLDMIGRVVGQAREGNSDAAYIPLLRARIKTNRSDGRTETLIAITLLLLGLSTALFLREYPKAIEIEADGVAINAWVAWNEFLNHAKDAGTSLHFVFSKAPSSQTFKYGSSHSSTLT
jgi:hypothetical protein